MSEGDLVRFDKAVVSQFLSEPAPFLKDWTEWIGIVTKIENETFCFVTWHDGHVRHEFIDYLEVVSESR